MPTEENINNQTEVIPDEVDSQATDPNSAVDETVETDDSTPAETPVSETTDDSFLSPENKKSIEAELVKNPDLKPNYDNWYKLMQGDYTRKRQSESKKVKDLEAQAAIVKQIQGDPELVKLIQQYKSGGLKQNTPQTEAVADIVDKWISELSPEEKMLWERFRPGIEALVGQKIDPLQKTAATNEEKVSMSELSNDPEFADIDVPTYWGAAKRIRGKYPNMTFREALAQAIGNDFENVASELKRYGGEDALSKGKKTEPAKKKAGFVAGGSGSEAESAVDDDANDLDAEAFRKKHKIPIAE